MLNRFIFDSVTGCCVSEIILCLLYPMRSKIFLLWDKEEIYMNEEIKVSGCFSSELRNHYEFILFSLSSMKGPEVMIVQE